MHIDGRKIENNSIIEGDICIIGAGAAGISIALDWLHTSKKVILLEGGGFEYEEQMQDLYKTKTNNGQEYFPIEHSRLHYFGGTTGHWGGYCSPYDDIDFEKRKWVDHSGWPITKKDLDPYYERSVDLFELKCSEFDLEYWKEEKPNLKNLPLDEKVVWSKIWQLSPPTRFGTKYKDDIVNAKNIHLYTYANVVNLEMDNEHSQIRQVTIKNHAGKTHQVKAKYFILACGAIQNSRLLLASNTQSKNGIGNDNDLVGRFFMEHIEMKISELWLEKPLNMNLYLFRESVHSRIKAELAISSEIQRKNEILNGTTYLIPLIYNRRIEDKYERWRNFGIQKKERSTWDKIKNRFLKIKESQETNIDKAYGLFTRIEQAPNPNSRIFIDSEKDALGMPRVDVDWKVSILEKKSLIKIHQIIGQQIGISNLGRIKIMENLLDLNDESWLKSTNGGWHQMGTTRMNNNPKEGVVDSDCKVHSLNNLYIAGSSCFPTGGAANPTFTIVALSLRLSDHIKDVLNKVNPIS